jgi:predicted lipid-binding transport protein (Tim44 family)
MQDGVRMHDGLQVDRTNSARGGCALLLRIAPLAILLMTVLPSAALAAAGGGSGGFGGGGGGGGFGGGGPGGTGSGGGLVSDVMVLIVLGVAVVIVIGGAIRRARVRKRRHERERQVELAALEAAEQDEVFAADRVRGDAECLFRDIQRAWDLEDRTRLGELVGHDLLIEWIRRLDDFKRKGWHNSVEVLGAVQVEYVGLVNREADKEDRVCVHVEGTLRDVVIDQEGEHIKRSASTSEITHLAEYWTLGKPDEKRASAAPDWILLSIEQDKEGAHQLEEPLVASPWSDTERLHEQAVVEQAAADKLPEGVHVADVAPLDFAGDACQAALDLSLADGRFAPALIDAEVRHAVNAWADAIDGDDSDLRRFALPPVIDELLYPGDKHDARLVVRGPHVNRLHVIRLDASADPAQITVELEVNGRRYIEDRDTTTILAGSRDHPRTFSERWTLSLAGDDVHPWQITGNAT